MVRKRKTEVKHETEEQVLVLDGSKTVTIEVPDPLDLVEHFPYVNHTRVVATVADVRIVVADLNPASKRKLSGVTGLVMSHQHARDFLRVMKTVIDTLDEHDQSTK